MSGSECQVSSVGCRMLGVGREGEEMGWWARDEGGGGGKAGRESKKGGGRERGGLIGRRRDWRFDWRVVEGGSTKAVGSVDLFEG